MQVLGLKPLVIDRWEPQSCLGQEQIHLDTAAACTTQKDRKTCRSKKIILELSL